MKRTKNNISDRASKLGIIHSAHYWSEEEINILKTYYPSERLSVCERLPFKTRHACASEAAKLGLRNHDRYWSEEEDKIIKKYYPFEGPEECAKHLKNRTALSCQQRAWKLKIKRLNDAWTEEELNILRTRYFKEGSKCFKDIINHPVGGCVSKVGELGLIYGKQGHRWTKAEDDLIIKYYSLEGKNMLNRLPDITLGQLSNRVFALTKKYGLKLVAPDSKSKKIMCVETGEIFNSAGEAQRKYNYKGDIGQCARDYAKGKDKTALGYHWKYLDE